MTQVNTLPGDDFFFKEKESRASEGTKKKPGTSSQDGLNYPEELKKFSPTSSTRNNPRVRCFDQYNNSQENGRILKPTLSSIAKSRNPVFIKSYARAEADRVELDCSNIKDSGTSDTVDNPQVLHNRKRSRISGKISGIKARVSDQQRDLHTDGEELFFHKDDLLELAHRDVEYLSEEIKNNPLFLHKNFKGPVHIKVVCPISRTITSTIELAPPRVLNQGYEIALYIYKISAPIGNLLMRAFLSIANKRELLLYDKPAHYCDSIMDKFNIHWFLVKGYPVATLSFWKVWIYHELKHGSLDEVLQIYFTALKRFRQRKKALEELTEYIELQLEKYISERACERSTSKYSSRREAALESSNPDLTNSPPRSRNSPAVKTPKVEERNVKHEHLLCTPPLRCPARVLDMRCLTSPRKRGVYDRLHVETHGEPKRIAASPSSPSAIPTLPTYINDHANQMGLATSPSRKVWRYAPSSGLPCIFSSPTRGPANFSPNLKTSSELEDDLKG